MASFTKIKANNKQGYKWICTLEGPPDPVTGKRKQIPRRGNSQKEAKERAEKALEEYIKHLGNDSKKLSKLTFEDVAKDWLKAYSKTKVKEITVDLRQQRINTILDYYGKLPIKKLTYKLHQDMLNDLDDKGYATNTIIGVHTTANMIMKYAMKHKWILENPCSDATIPEKPLTVEEIENDPIEESYFEKEELTEFLSATKEYGQYMDNEIFHLLAFTGMRAGELCALHDYDFFFDTKEIRISKTLYYPKNNMRTTKLTPPKTDGSVRRIGMIDAVMEALKKHIEHLESYRAENKKLYEDYNDKPFVFAHPNGYPLIPKNINSRMQQILKKTSIKKKGSPHIFRHTHISMLTEANVDLKTIMDRVGHEDARTTLKIYTHVTNKMKENALEKLEQHFADIIRL